MPKILSHSSVLIAFACHALHVDSTSRTTPNRAKVSETLTGLSLSHLALSPKSLPPEVLSMKHDSYAAQPLKMLEKGSMDGAKPVGRLGVLGRVPKQNSKDAVFEAVSVSFIPSASPPSDRDASLLEGRASESQAKSLCVVYGVGTGGDSAFEESMARQGCEVHAFDCTGAASSRSSKSKRVQLHPWCIGLQADASSLHAAGQHKSQLKFKTLAQSMDELGHKQLDLLKIDAGGLEWNILQRDVLGEVVRPTQLAFELHTEGSSAGIAEELMKGKDYTAVNRLFLDLHKDGYRVVNKQINRFDHSSAEFVLVKLSEPGSGAEIVLTEEVAQMKQSSEGKEAVSNSIEGLVGAKPNLGKMGRTEQLSAAAEAIAQAHADAVGHKSKTPMKSSAASAAAPAVNAAASLADRSKVVAKPPLQSKVKIPAKEKPKVALAEKRIDKAASSKTLSVRTGTAFAPVAAMTPALAVSGQSTQDKPSPLARALASARPGALQKQAPTRTLLASAKPTKSSVATLAVTAKVRSLMGKQPISLLARAR